MTCRSYAASDGTSKVRFSIDQINDLKNGPDEVFADHRGRDRSRRASAMLLWELTTYQGLCCP
jgi:hypothetical protein